MGLVESLGACGSAYLRYMASPTPQVGDLLQQLANAGRPQPAKRQRLGDAGFVECTPVKLAEGTEVVLQPAGQGAPAPFGGEMPAELAAATSWLYSHKGADGQAWIMNLPVTIGGKSYPLYYFYGTVLESALTVDASGDGQWSNGL